jgi:hypothetical protein
LREIPATAPKLELLQRLPSYGVRVMGHLASLLRMTDPLAPSHFSRRDSIPKLAVASGPACKRRYGWHANRIGTLPADVFCTKAGSFFYTILSGVIFSGSHRAVRLRSDELEHIAKDVVEHGLLRLTNDDRSPDTS